MQATTHAGPCQDVFVASCVATWGNLPSLLGIHGVHLLLLVVQSPESSGAEEVHTRSVLLGSLEV